MGKLTDSNDEASALFNEMGAVMAAPHRMKLRFSKEALARARALQHPARAVAINMAKALSVAEKFEQERRAALAVAPNVAIPICVDQLAVNTESGVITVSAPYNGQPWTLCDIILDARGTSVAANATAATTTIYSHQMRISQFKIAGIDFVNTAASFASGGPTTPGLSPGLWAYDKQHVPENKFRPWAGYALRPEATILIKVYHEGTAASPAMSLNMTLLVRSSPCNEQWNGMYQGNAATRQMARLAAYRIPHASA